MKKTFAFLLLFVSITFLPAVTFADEYGIVFYVGVGGDNSEEPGVPEEPGHPGRRTVPYPIYCVIDFDKETISGSSILDEVIGYEIWDESGFSILFATSDERWFVETLASMPNNTYYLLVLKTPDSTYSGYLDF